MAFELTAESCAVCRVALGQAATDNITDVNTTLTLFKFVPANKRRGEKYFTIYLFFQSQKAYSTQLSITRCFYVNRPSVSFVKFKYY